MTMDLSSLARSLRGVRLLVVGDLMLDEYITGSTDRVSPEAPVPVVRFESESFALGGAANAAAGAAALGGSVTLVGVVGEDRAARRIEDLAKCGRIDYRGFVAADRGTTVKTRIIANHQQIARIDREESAPLSASAESGLVATIEKAMALVDGALISDYGKGMISGRVAGAVMEEARTRSLPVVVDPKGTQFRKYRGATVIKPNEREAIAAAGDAAVRKPVDLCEVGAALQETLGGSAVLITRGADGMLLLEAGSPPFYVHSRVVHVYDVTGAGDTAAAALALGLAAGADLGVATTLADCAASIVVSKRGTASVAEAELVHAVDAALAAGLEDRVLDDSGRSEGFAVQEHEGLPSLR